MIGFLPVAASVLAILDDGDEDVEALFQRAVLTRDPKILTDQLSEAQRQAFRDRLFAWFSASKDPSERHERKKVVQIFDDIEIYPNVTLDRMPSIHFSDHTDYTTLRWLWSSFQDEVVVEVRMKDGAVLGDENGAVMTIEGDFAILKDPETKERLKTVPLDDVEAIVVQ